MDAKKVWPASTGELSGCSDDDGGKTLGEDGSIVIVGRSWLPQASAIGGSKRKGLLRPTGILLRSTSRSTAWPLGVAAVRQGG